VLLGYSAGSFGLPVLKNAPILGDRVVELPPAMSLGDAISLKNNAGHNRPFQFANLRWPLSPNINEPLYIFTEAAGGHHVFVGTKSRKVFTAETAHEGETVAETISLQQRTKGVQTRLCTALGLVYKAYKRPYPGGGSVLTLLASGYHTIAPMELYFVGVECNPNRYRLMENVPYHFFRLTTFYSPGFCSHYGLTDLKETVTIEDGHGKHTVGVEEFGS
jgi:hypothetical protein